METQLNNFHAIKETAYIAFSLKDYSKARDYFLVLLTECQNDLDTDTYRILSNDYAVSLLFTRNHKLALQLLQENKLFFEEKGDFHQMGLVLGNIGTAYELNRDLKKAEEAYQKAVQNINKTLSAEEMYLCLKSLAIVRMKLGNIKQAIFNYWEAVEVKPHLNFFGNALKFLLRLALHS